MEEEWRVIEDWPDYKISRYGEVYNIRRDRLLKIHIDGHGYPMVNLARAGKWLKIYVHRLVALAFVDGYFDGAFVNHIDGDKQNNVDTNLEWVTNKENIQHAMALGLNPGRVPQKRRIIMRIEPDGSEYPY